MNYGRGNKSSENSSSNSLYSERSVHNSSMVADPEPRTDSLVVDDYGNDLQVEATSFAAEPDQKKKKNIFRNTITNVNQCAKKTFHSAGSTAKNIGSAVDKNVGKISKGASAASSKVPFLKEFLAFISKGNVIDLAVAVIIGTAFTAIVTSLNTDMISPFIALAIGQGALSQVYELLRAPKNWANNATLRERYQDSNGNFKKPATLDECKAIGCVTLNYGNFLQTIINFLIIALVVFGIVKIIGIVYRKETVATTQPCEFCAEDIKLTAKKCPHCLEPVPQVKVSNGEESSADEKEELLSGKDSQVRN